MIFNDVHFFSPTLGLQCEMYILLPQYRPFVNSVKVDQPYKTLYLLHGLSDNHTAWMRQTSIERYAADRGLAVVMPAVHRSFYTNMAHGGKYWDFISQEVLQIAREYFPLSDKREDNYVAGLSMGGYGALKLGLSCPDKFSAAASLSGAVEIRNIHKSNPEKEWQEEMSNIFGNPDLIAGSENDTYALAEKVSKETVKPRIYQCCGTEDFLYEFNIKFRDFIKPLGFDYTYEEGPGAHEWSFWDKHIEKVINWIYEK